MNKDSIVSKLSPTDTSLEGLLAKLGVSWTGLLAGVGLSDIFTLASLVYVLLNIYVLVRDKIIRKEPAKISAPSDQETKER